MRQRLARIAAVALAVAGWLVFGFMSWYALSLGQQFSTGHVFQVDWHVFWAGARDLVDRELYRIPLDAGGLPLSATAFRLPPFSAVWPLPLLPLPVATGGLLWQAIAAGSIAGAAIITLDLAAVRRPWLWAGLALGPLGVTLMYLEGLHLGTNNYLVLLLVAAGCWCHLRGHQRWAGVLIGLAIATKLWPVVLVAVMLRERRWSELRWTAGTVIVQGLVLPMWLGPDVVGDMLATLSVAIPPTGLLIGPTAFPGIREAWNAGLGVVACVGLLAPPLRGRAALGATIIAGMAPIGNLWIHYAPTILFGLALIATDALLGGRLVRRSTGRQLSITEQPPA